MILQNTKNQTAGFSLMQLLGGSKDIQNGETFAQLLSQLGLNSEEVATQEFSSDFSDLLLKGDALTDETLLQGAGIDLKHLKIDAMDALLASLDTDKNENSSIKNDLLQLLLIFPVLPLNVF